MAINTVALRNIMADAYGDAAVYAALFSTALGGTPPNNTAGTEVTGGSYARQPITWTTATTGVITGTVTFSVPTGNVMSAGVYATVTGGAFLDGGAVTTQAFATAGTYTLTLTYTQS